MGVKRKLEESQSVPDRDIEEYGELRPIMGRSMTERRWACFYAMMDWCFLKLGYEICKLDERTLNVLDRRSAYFNIHNRTLLATMRPGWASTIEKPTENQYRLGASYVKRWNTCIRTNLLAMNNTFRNVVVRHDYLHIMRDNFLVPMRQYLREYFECPDNLAEIIDLDDF